MLALALSCQSCRPPDVIFSLLLREPACPSSPALLLGMARADFLSSLFVADIANMAPSPSTRSLARFDPALLIPQSAHLSSSMLVQQYTRLELTMFASGLSWLGASPLASGEAKPGLLPLSHSPARTEAAMLVSGFSHVGLLLFSRSLGCLGAACSFVRPNACWLGLLAAGGCHGTARAAVASTKLGMSRVLRVGAWSCATWLQLTVAWMCPR